MNTDSLLQLERSCQEMLQNGISFKEGLRVAAVCASWNLDESFKHLQLESNHSLLPEYS
jgi:hypothetical protein